MLLLRVIKRVIVRVPPTVTVFGAQARTDQAVNVLREIRRIIRRVVRFLQGLGLTLTLGA